MHHETQTMSVQQLILRANRYLAASLLEKRLITSADVERANSRLLTLLQSQSNQRISVLSILIYDLQALDEDSLIRYLVENHQVGLMNLGHFRIEQAPLDDVSFEECSATMSIPFDRIGNAVCIATCYFLSKPVIDYWENRFDKVLWYTTSVASLTNALDQIPRTQPESDTGVDMESNPG